MARDVAPTLSSRGVSLAVELIGLIGGKDLRREARR